MRGHRQSGQAPRAVSRRGHTHQDPSRGPRRHLVGPPTRGGPLPPVEERGRGL